MKCNLRIPKNYKDITLTAIAAKFYNVLFLNHFQPEFEKIHRKNQNRFQRNQSTTSQNLTIYQIIEVQKILRKHF